MNTFQKNTLKIVQLSLHVRVRAFLPGICFWSKYTVIGYVTANFIFRTVYIGLEKKTRSTKKSEEKLI